MSLIWPKLTGCKSNHELMDVKNVAPCCVIVLTCNVIVTAFELSPSTLPGLDSG